MKHQERKSELVRGTDGEVRFRAVCSCGWKSEPVSPEQVLISWQDHAESEPGR